MADLGSVVTLNVSSALLSVGAGKTDLVPIEEAELFFAGEAATKSHLDMSEQDDLFFKLNVRLTLGPVPDEVLNEVKDAIGLLMFKSHSQELMSSRIYVGQRQFDVMNELISRAPLSGEVTTVLTTTTPISNQIDWQRLLIKGLEVRRSYDWEKIDG